MVKVPDGDFWMGCNASPDAGEAFDQWCHGDEKPQHLVTTSVYFMDILESSAAAYVEFLNASGKTTDNPVCTTAGLSGPCFFSDTSGLIAYSDGVWLLDPGSEHMPVYNISYWGAAEYCAFNGKRLCTEAEWEKAARGGCETYGEDDCRSSSRPYPWGTEYPDCDLAHSLLCDPSGYAPVGSHPSGASAYWIEDLSGNVDEWVADCYHSSYVGAPDTSTQWNCEPGWTDGVTRGGDKNADFSEIRAGAREKKPLTGSHRPGVRCCRSSE